MKGFLKVILNFKIKSSKAGGNGALEHNRTVSKYSSLCRTARLCCTPGLCWDDTRNTEAIHTVLLTEVVLSFVILRSPSLFCGKDFIQVSISFNSSKTGAQHVFLNILVLFFYIFLYFFTFEFYFIAYYFY